MDHVDLKRGLINREVFVDRGIYEHELERIFARSWLYLGHESQLKNSNDYFTTHMGEDPVVVTRDDSGRIRAFHNSCRHRGMMLCRADQGNTSMFRCPYHGWTYSSGGRLIGVPRLESAYYGELDREQWGLIEVTQLDSFGGLIFATWDPKAPPLHEYLGDMAFYLDLLVNRMESGLEVIGGVQKFMLPANWKLITESFAGDPSHVSATHGSAIDAGYRTPIGDKGYCIYTANGHSLSGEAGGILRGRALQTEYSDFLAEMGRQVAERKGEFARQLVPLGVGVIFPTLVFIDSPRYRMIRVAHPRGPQLTEIHSWCLVDKALPEGLKEATRRQYIVSFGPGGLFEVDDGEVLSGCMAGMRGVVGRRFPLNYQQGLGHDDRPASDFFGSPDVPGRIGQRFFTEGNMRHFYGRWRELMNGYEGKKRKSRNTAMPTRRRTDRRGDHS